MAKILGLLTFALMFMLNNYLLAQAKLFQTRAFSKVEATEERVIFELKPFEVSFTPTVILGEQYLKANVRGFGETIEPGYPMVPQTGALVNVPTNAEVTLSVLESRFEDIQDVALAPAADRVDDLQAGEIAYQHFIDPVYKQNTFWPPDLARISNTTHWQGLYLSRIQINPVQYNPVSKVLRVHKSVRFEVTFSKPFHTEPSKRGPASGITRLADHLLLNPGFRDKTPAKPASFERPLSTWYRPQATYYKLFVEEQGLYSVFLQDLMSAGAPTSSFPLSELEIFHNGEQIPIWIEGPQGAKLGSDHVIYFYGDRHRPEQGFYDLFTDTSIYWLTVNADEPGLRYQKASDVEQAGHEQAYYWETIHIEKDSIFFRWDGSSSLELGEGWIWRYLFDDQREVTQFKVSGLDRTAASCSLSVRVQGTTRTDVNPDHHVRFYLNSVEVGEVFFDDREEGLFVAALPSTLIRDGLNRLDVHLVPDTGAEINQVVLDWVEVTYPRALGFKEHDLKFDKDENQAVETKFTIQNIPDSTVIVVNPHTQRMWQKAALPTSFYKIESAGFEDGNFARISADFQTYTFQSRGHHLVAIDHKSGEVQTRSFDTYESPENANEMGSLINSLSDSTIVLVAIMDEGSRMMTEVAYAALESVGSTLTRQVESRDSWALIGWKGAPPDSVAEQLSKRLNGPVLLEHHLHGQLAARFAASFVDVAEPGPFYYATTPSGLKSVEKLEVDQSSDLRSSGNAADYIVITHNNFQNAAERLARYREEHNAFRTVVIDVQDVYDEFNFGIVNPQAIKDFLQFAYGNWQPPKPSYVVLLGDASWDPKRLMPDATKTNFVPTFGDPVSDNWLVAFDDSNGVLPNMFIGRIPAESLQQAHVVIDKIEAYEALPFDAWNKEFVFFNGGISENEQGTFRSQAKNLIENYITRSPLGGDPTQINKTTDEVITVSLFHDAVRRIERGALWLNFLGHGGSSVWDISIGQPEDWNNSEIFPFVTGMSCHSSRFANPSLNSLSEQYLLSPMGAIAYWGSSGFGFVTQDFFLLEGIFQAISEGGVRSIGEATTLSKFHVWQVLGDHVRNRMVIDQYVLAGDPALSLALSVKPELAVKSEEIELGSTLILTADSTTTVTAKVRNFGTVPSDSVDVDFRLMGPDGRTAPLGSTMLAGLTIVDSLSYSWTIPEVPGQYQLQVEVDPFRKIDEVNIANNVGKRQVDIYASDLSLLKPVDFGIVSSADVNLVVNNSRIARNDLLYFFEIDSSETFESAVLIRSPPINEVAAATYWRTSLVSEGLYYWRVRTFDGLSFGPWVTFSFNYELQPNSKWRQARGRQFQKNGSSNLDLFSSDAALLPAQALLYRAESAGLLDGNYALLSLNSNVVGLNSRGHNLAVFDQEQGQFVESASFDTWEDEVNAEAMAGFVEALPEGRRVLVAIRDEGTRFMNERAYLALEGLGSSLTREVGRRDSWAIIGRKGAPIGSVPEVLKKSGEGPATVVDTLFRFSKVGRMISSDIGPALTWNSGQFDFEIPSLEARISFQVAGLNLQTGSTDTLKSEITAAQVDLSDIDANVYPKIKLIANLFSDDGLSTPRLNSWGVDYQPPADLVVGRGSVEVATDTVLIGDDVNLDLKIGNFGLSPSDSFWVSLSANGSGASLVALQRFRAPPLAIDELRVLPASISTSTLTGRTDVTLRVDPEQQIRELNDSNNEFTFTIWVEQDTVSPEIRITFDGQAVAGGDFVSPEPQVSVEIRDAAILTFSDTSQVTILLNETRVPYGLGPGQAQLLPQQNSQDRELRAISVFEPKLPEGSHKIEVIARDLSDNLRYFQTEVHVNEDFLLANVLNYPNPFRDQTSFTYVLTQEADLVKLKIYTVSGRLIQEFDFLPMRAGFNQFLWDGRDFDGDELSNGVYFYKIIARKGDQQREVVEKLVVMR